MSGIQQKISYRYPDSREILNRPRNQIYWEQSEIRLINRAISSLIKVNEDPGNMRILDAGCGEGRLIGSYEQFFSEVMAVDPDLERLQRASKKAIYWGCGNKFSLRCCSIHELSEDRQFDFILCNHVLEHLNTSLIGPTLCKISSLLKDDGLALLTTAHSQREDHFIKTYQGNDSMPKSNAISEDEFNMLCTQTTEGVLPVYKGTLDRFESLLCNSSLKVLSSMTYQIIEDLGDFESAIFKDIIANSRQDFRERLGQNMAFICRRAF